MQHSGRPRLLSLLCLAASALACLGSAADAQAMKPKVVVLEFNNVAEWGGMRLGETAADMLAEMLAAKGDITVVDRRAIEATTAEENIGVVNAPSLEDISTIAEEMGIQAVVMGRVESFRRAEESDSPLIAGAGKDTFLAELSIRLLDVGQRRVTHEDRAVGSADNCRVSILGLGGGRGYDEVVAARVLRPGMLSLAAGILLVAPSISEGRWEARISRVEKDRIWISRGSDAEVEQAEVLTVYRRGKEILDPATGDVLGLEEAAQGRIEIVEVQKKFSVARVVDGRDFKVGDFVRRR